MGQSLWSLSLEKLRINESAGEICKSHLIIPVKYTTNAEAANKILLWVGSLSVPGHVRLLFEVHRAFLALKQTAVEMNTDYVL